MTKVKADSSPETTDASKIRKEKSREKEYRRAKSINTAFDNLQQRIPYLRDDERKHLPKIKTLRLAMQYISHLKKLLDGDAMIETESNESRQLTHTDFRFFVTDELRVRNSYRERAHSQEMDRATVQRILARENRRRCTFIQDEMQGYIQQPTRQFGPISSNIYNYRHINANQFDANQLALQGPMMQFPVQSFVAPPANQFAYSPLSVEMVEQQMMENNYPPQ